MLTTQLRSETALLTVSMFVFSYIIVDHLDAAENDTWETRLNTTLHNEKLSSAAVLVIKLLPAALLFAFYGIDLLHLTVK